METILTTASVIECPRGGTASLAASRASFSVSGNPVLLETENMQWLIVTT